MDDDVENTVVIFTSGDHPEFIPPIDALQVGNTTE